MTTADEVAVKMKEIVGDQFQQITSHERVLGNGSIKRMIELVWMEPANKFTEEKTEVEEVADEIRKKISGESELTVVHERSARKFYQPGCICGWKGNQVVETQEEAWDHEAYLEHLADLEEEEKEKTDES